MSQITIRNIDPKIESVLRRKAREDGTSLSAVANTLICKALGVDENPEKLRNLKAYSGKWRTEDREEFEQSQEIFDIVDDEVWK